MKPYGMSDEDLKESVRNLMIHNLSEGHSRLLDEEYSYVMPSPGNYHFQWWWDTCFHVFILCAIGECDRAKKNLTSLFEMQREDGFVGHMIFWKSFFPRSKLNIYQSKLSVNEFRPHMSSLIQPPLAAQALWRIYEETHDLKYVSEMLPKIKRQLKWLREHRDFDGDGLISIISVFESGIDWKPSFDLVLGFSNGQATEKFFKKVISVERKNFFHRYDLKKIYKDDYFIVKETMVNTMYAKDLEMCAGLCSLMNDSEAEFYERLSQKVSDRIYEIMYDEEQLAFFDVYGKTNKKAKALSFTIGIPLLLRNATDEMGQAIIKKHFLNKDEFDLPFPVPSTAKNDPAFDQSETKFLWRGPTWILSNWMMQQCFHRFGFYDEAKHLVSVSKELVEKHGFREYYNSFTGEPYGAHDFTWGGLVIDMMRKETVFSCA